MGESLLFKAEFSFYNIGPNKSMKYAETIYIFLYAVCITCNCTSCIYKKLNKKIKK